MVSLSKYSAKYSVLQHFFLDAELLIIEFHFTETYEDGMKLDTICSMAWLTWPTKWAIDGPSLQCLHSIWITIFTSLLFWGSRALGTLPMSNSISASVEGFRFKHLSTSLQAGMSSTVTGSLTFEKTSQFKDVTSLQVKKLPNWPPTPRHNKPWCNDLKQLKKTDVM